MTLTRTEAATRLGVSYRTMIRLESRHNLTPCPLRDAHGEYRFDVHHIDALLPFVPKGRATVGKSPRVLTVKEAKRKAGRGTR